MYKLNTKLGSLEYQPVKMLHVDLAVAKWKATHKPPKPPLIRKEWDATIKAYYITQSMKKYAKDPRFLDSETKKALRDEINEKLPMVENPYDKDYLKAKEQYANDVYSYHWQQVIQLGVISTDENSKVFALLMAYDKARDKQTDEETKATDEYKRGTYRFMIYDAILKVSCVTSELVHNCLLALDRYYKGEPFLDVLERRSDKTDDNVPNESFRHSMDSLLMDKGMYEYAQTVDIEERAMLCASLLSSANMKVWNMEDARQEALSKANSGIVKSMVSR